MEFTYEALNRQGQSITGKVVANSTGEAYEKLREAGVVYKVYKNTMMTRAFAGTEFEGLTASLEGTNAIAISKDDATAPARVLAKFAKGCKALEIKAGVVEGVVYDAKGMAEIANIPSRDVLIAKFMGSIQSPVSKAVRTFQAIADAKAKVAMYTNNKIAQLQQANDFDGIIKMSETIADKALAQKVAVQAYFLKKDYAKVIEIVNQIRARAAKGFVAADETTVGSYSMENKIDGTTTAGAAANYRIGTYDDSYATADKAWDALEREYRLEFGMEGHRWFDIARWGKVADVLNTYAASESRYLGKFVNPFSASCVNFPIPTSEINTAMGRFVQTANWK